MSGHDPLDVVRSGVETLRRGTSVAAPPPPAAVPTQPPAERDSAPRRTQAGGDGGGEAADPGSARGREGTGTTGTTGRDRTDKTGSRTRPARSKDTATTEEEPEDLPGFARGARRQIGVGLTEDTFEQLRSARGTKYSNGDIVLEALRRTHNELVAEYAPQPDTGDDLFPTQPRRKRRLGIEGVRRMEFMCSPAEAAVIGELAQRCDLSLSALVEEALRRHLTSDEPHTGH